MHALIVRIERRLLCYKKNNGKKNVKEKILKNLLFIAMLVIISRVKIIQYTIEQSNF